MVVIAAILATGYVVERKNSNASKPAPPAAVLDGAYRLDFDKPKATSNGVPSSQKESHSTWWAFRSTCTHSACVATGTQLDGKNHEVALTEDGGDRAIFMFRDGRWQEIPDRTSDACESGGRETTIMAVLSVEPQANGTLSGSETDTELGNECSGLGQVDITPVVLTRIGDVPPSVAVADPANFTNAISTSTRAPVAGPVLDGTYRLDYAKTTVNGVPWSGGDSNTTQWWAFRSLCVSAGCVASGIRLDDNDHQAPIGPPVWTAVYHLTDGNWQVTPDVEGPTPCPGTNGAVKQTEKLTRSLQPHADGTLGGLVTGSILTNECGHQGMEWRTPITATRTGDVPPSVILADPALFVAPPAANGPH